MGEQCQEAISLKNQGNKAFGKDRYADALEAYSRARGIWSTANIRGHHVAVLWSNEAACHKKVSDWDKCIHACEQGLEHFCTAKIRQKLDNSLKEAQGSKEAAQAAAAAIPVAGERDMAAAVAKPSVPRNPPTKLQAPLPREEGKVPLYPGGSAQGKVHNPGPFICGFEEAKDQGFVDGVDGWKDKKVKEEQELDRELVDKGLMSPDLLDDPNSLDLVNHRRPPGLM